MNFKILALASIVSVGLTVSCGNIYEGVANKNPSEAKIDEVESAFVKGECGKVISLLKGEVDRNRQAFKENPSSLDARNKYALNKKRDYMYVNASMTCSGFSTLSAIDVLANDSEASKDIFFVVGKLAGVSSVDNVVVTNKINGFNEAFFSCELMPRKVSDSPDADYLPKLDYTTSVISAANNTGTPQADTGSQIVNGVLEDKDYKMVCGLSSAVISILNVADMTLELTKEKDPTGIVDLRQKSIEKMLSNVEPTTLIKSIDEYINTKSRELDGNTNKPVNNINKFGNYITQNINFIQGASQVIADTLNNDSFKSTIDDFTSDLFDPKDGRVTKTSLVNYFLKLQGQTVRIESWEQYSDCLKMTSEADKGSCPITMPTTPPPGPIPPVQPVP